MTEMTSIYFIQGIMGGPIKIGKADNCIDRLASHQTSNWQKLRVIILVKDCDRRLEKEIHKHFKHLRIRGELFEDKILHDLGLLLKVIKDNCLHHKGKKEDDWLLFLPNKGKSDLSYKIKIYSDNKFRRLYNSVHGSQKKQCIVKEFEMPNYA